MHACMNELLFFVCRACTGLFRREHRGNTRPLFTVHFLVFFAFGGVVILCHFSYIKCDDLHTRFNKHAHSYTWKWLGKNMSMDKTLAV